MTILYDIAFTLFSLVYLPYLIFTGRYHRDFRQRFGVYPDAVREALKGGGSVWVHAVSVGEVMAARLFCERLLERYPDKRMVISTTTRTGNGVAARFFKERAVIIYLPVDISCVVNKAIDIIGPEIFVMVETEIWPNLITALHRRGVPIALVNGRISPRSYGRYVRIRFLIRGILEKVAIFCMQNAEYAARIINMGAPAQRVLVTGNMKFDTAGGAGAPDKLNIDAVRGDLGLAAGQPLFIAGSTHRPEEEIVLKAYRALLKDFPDLRLLIAPRHIERAGEIEGIVRRFHFTPLRVSNITNHESRTTNDETPVLLLDTMGRLSRLFSAAAVVFMGGSLIKKGGQNIIEPAIFARPIIFGAHMFNFKDIAESFLSADAACAVKDGPGLLEAARRLLGDDARRRQLGGNARAIIEKNRGATDRNVEAIVKTL